MTLALKLHLRGAGIVVIDRARCFTGASIAAAGMLAVDDPHNPTEIKQLSRFSADAYPSFLQSIGNLSGFHISFQTDRTVQYLPDGRSTRLHEHSLDPRQLAVGLYEAVKRTSILLLENSSISDSQITADGWTVLKVASTEIRAKNVVYTAGVWTPGALNARNPSLIMPRKGQMLRVKLPATLPLHEVHRNAQVYIVPRSVGHQAGSALIGATVEDIGYNMTLRTGAITRLRAMASELLPHLASEIEAPLLETWTGLRPFTLDALPILGRLRQASHFVATGHYRNGILLAPGTAQVMADLIEGKQPSIDLTAFSPQRFSPI